MKKAVIALVLVMVLALAMAAPVLADKPNAEGEHGSHGGEDGGGKDWNEWCHAHWDMGHIEHPSWVARCDPADFDIHPPGTDHPEP